MAHCGYNLAHCTPALLVCLPPVGKNCINLFSILGYRLTRDVTEFVVMMYLLIIELEYRRVSRKAGKQVRQVSLYR